MSKNGPSTPPNLPRFSTRATTVVTLGWCQLKLAQSNDQPHIFSMLPDEQPGPEQIAALRAMTGQARLNVAQSLYWAARKLKTAGVRAQHPDWTEEQVNDEVRRIYLHARG